MTSVPVRIEPSFREKVWGTTNLRPLFPDASVKIGEVWFERPDLPLLVKFIFTSDRLSVQVHPDDEYALRHENSRGKSEMWYILRADPGATIALGFREKITRQRLRESAVSGEIENLLRWFPVKPGEAYLTLPGTVHAIGAGIALCEIQQYSDVTYRLYDYGRPRQLHLDKGVDVADPEPHPGPALPDGRTLVSCDHFVTELLEWNANLNFAADPARQNLLITLEGAGSLAGQPFRPGECWLTPPGAGDFPVHIDAPARLLRTYAP